MEDRKMDKLRGGGVGERYLLNLLSLWLSDEEREKLIDDNVLVGGYHNTSRHLMKHFGCIISIPTSVCKYL